MGLVGVDEDEVDRVGPELRFEGRECLDRVPIRTSIRPATSARRQAGRPMFGFSLMSQVITRPFELTASAMHSVLYPVNVPTSITMDERVNEMRKARSRPSSAGTCMEGPIGSSAVSSRSDRRISSSCTEAH